MLNQSIIVLKAFETTTLAYFERENNKRFSFRSTIIFFEIKSGITNLSNNLPVVTISLLEYEIK